MAIAFLCAPWRRLKAAPNARSTWPITCSLTKADRGTKRQSGNTKLQLPDFVPLEAYKIQDENALSMLRNMKLDSIQTSLRNVPLETAHIQHIPVLPEERHTSVMLLHGFDSNCLEYRNLLPHLCDHCHVFVPDMLGWGLTEKPFDVGYGPVERREHLFAYWRHCINHPVTLVGASLGGAIAIDFAQRYPEAVSKLVLVDAQAYQDRPINKWVRDYSAIARIGAEVLRSNWLRWLAIYLSYEDKSFRNEDVLRMGALHCRTNGWKEAAVEFIRGEGYCLSASVKDVDLPTLVVWGMKDRILPVENAERFKKDIRGSKVEVIEDAGHSPHLEKAEVTAVHILDFVLGERDWNRERLNSESAI